MEANLFATGEKHTAETANMSDVPQRRIPDYTVFDGGLLQKLGFFLIGFLAGFFVLFIFYKWVPIAATGGMVIGCVYIPMGKKQSMQKRILKLRMQFFDLLEAMSVSMRAGNPVLKALQSAREDLRLIYPEDSDILVELDLIISKFNNAVPLSQAFLDLAQRSKLEDINSFASVYATIEGKSSRADEIVRETQQIIAEKMQIEMEIDTLMTAAKSEVNIMLILPLVILAVIGYAGAGFMDAIYTTAVGRLVATGGFAVFLISYGLAKKFSNVKI